MKRTTATITRRPDGKWRARIDSRYSYIEMAFGPNKRQEAIDWAIEYAMRVDDDFDLIIGRTGVRS